MATSFSNADIYCLWNDAESRFSSGRVRESWLASTPLRRAKALALPLMPAVWRTLAVNDYDWVLVSSHLFAHHVGVPTARKEIPAFAYIHTPARYIWTPELDARGQGRAARLAAPFFRHLDRRAAAEPVEFAANSRFVKDRIFRVWGRDSRVIYPPVDITKLQKCASWADELDGVEHEKYESTPETFILGASRFVDYKQLSKVIEVGEACDLPVVLAGSGPEKAHLEQQAKEASVPVMVIDSPSNEFLYALYQKAMLYVFPPVEDFGIMPVEAIALGTPVLVNEVGGASESTAMLKGGSTIPGGPRSEILTAVDDALSKDMRTARENAQLFSRETFSTKLQQWMGSAV